MLRAVHSLAADGPRSVALLTIVIMPCLNEAEHVAGAAASLGFAPDAAQTDDTHLVVVDNGSTDATPTILRDLAATCGSVHVTSEPRRGYVPARRRGVEVATDLVRAAGLSADDALLLQADADTRYKRGYVDAMRAAMTGRQGVVLEGATRRPPEFEIAHPDYVAAERAIDEAAEALEGPDEDQIVVDDKVCGFLLGDYLKWGGLREEFSSEAEPIHAETTRLFIRAKLRFGAAKLRVNPAGAASSRRRTIENAWLQFATSGFPRERSWVSRKTARQRRGRDVDEFGRAVLEGREPEAVFLRRAHDLALFRYLPAVIGAARSGHERQEPAGDIAAVLNALPDRPASFLAKSPGTALTDMLHLIDERPSLFSRVPG